MNSATGKVKLPLRVILGESKIDVDTLAAIGEGSIIGLDRLAGEAVDVEVSGTRIGRGEVVCIDDYFGIRITELEEDRLS